MAYSQIMLLGLQKLSFGASPLRLIGGRDPRSREPE